MITYTFKKGDEAAVDLKSIPYTWGGSASTYAVNVESSEVIGKPAMKPVKSFSWDYLHGSTPDLRNQRYQNKEIVLECWMRANSKQQFLQRFNHFANWLRYDDLMWLNISWSGNDGNIQISPDPHASKGIYQLVYLKSISKPKYRFRFGKQIARFTVTFEDPYPVKQVLRYYSDTPDSNDGVDYDIISDSEIDIFTDDGQRFYDILSERGHIDFANYNHIILVCGDIDHATTSNQSGELVTPTSQHDAVETIYSEI